MSNLKGNADLTEAGQASNRNRSRASEEKIAAAIQRLHQDDQIITVARVAEQAGVNPSTVRRHTELFKQVVDLRDKTFTARVKTSPRARHTSADYEQIRGKYLAAQFTINEMQARITVLEATADRALLGVAASPKHDALEQAQDHAADLAVQLANTNDVVKDKDRRIENLEADIDAQADVNRDLFTQLTAAQEESQSLRRKITKLNLELGAKAE